MRDGDAVSSAVLDGVFLDGVADGVESSGVGGRADPQAFTVFC